MIKLTEKGKTLISYHRMYHELDYDEMNCLILLDAGIKPGRGYYDEAIKSLKKKGLVEQKGK